MTSQQNLHYALGELVYAMARADGQIQVEEKKAFQNIVEAELRSLNHNFNISDIIFKILQKDKRSMAEAYEWAMKEIKLNSHYLSPELKSTFIKVIDKIAKAYPPVTKEEKELFDRFGKEFAPLTGDPVYYK
jgi:uncharacterized tellurite resistance protein B-like protein